MAVLLSLNQASLGGTARIHTVRNRKKSWSLYSVAASDIDHLTPREAHDVYGRDVMICIGKRFSYPVGDEFMVYMAKSGKGSDELIRAMIRVYITLVIAAKPARRKGLWYINIDGWESPGNECRLPVRDDATTNVAGVKIIYDPRWGVGDTHDDLRERLNRAETEIADLRRRNERLSRLYIEATDKSGAVDDYPSNPPDSEENFEIAVRLYGGAPLPSNCSWSR